jgi:hypothetical protein
MSGTKQCHQTSYQTCAAARQPFLYAVLYLLLLPRNMGCGRYYPACDPTILGKINLYGTSLPAVWWCAININSDDRSIWKNG